MTATREREFEAGDYLEPDGWPPCSGENIRKADGFSDSSFPGCQFRLPSVGGELAINLTRTGKDHYIRNAYGRNQYRNRVKIEWVGDGEPSTFSHGWIYHS